MIVRRGRYKYSHEIDWSKSGHAMITTSCGHVMRVLEDNLFPMIFVLIGIYNVQHPTRRRQWCSEQSKGQRLGRSRLTVIGGDLERRACSRSGAEGSGLEYISRFR